MRETDDMPLTDDEEAAFWGIPKKPKKPEPFGVEYWLRPDNKKGRIRTNGGTVWKWLILPLYPVVVLADWIFWPIVSGGESISLRQSARDAWNTWKRNV